MPVSATSLETVRVDTPVGLLVVVARERGVKDPAKKLIATLVVILVQPK